MQLTYIDESGCWGPGKEKLALLFNWSAKLSEQVRAEVHRSFHAEICVALLSFQGQSS
ncbi:hypothetical protein TWF694_003119 [Orbilia ellipsospora]|uniref:DUF3800 domain-containing protein n=1 Tax=Orbilia ellipsospora TaxID=2528407 RepID=A0AAV9X1T9_9PEZI